MVNLDNIEIIIKNVHKDLNNTIVNYTNKFDIRDFVNDSCWIE